MHVVEQHASRHAFVGVVVVGLDDAVVIATATRLQADAIVTLDVRDFSAVKIPGSPELWPRDR